MFYQRLLIHQKRGRMGKESPKLVEDGESMGINVSPVMDVPFTQPVNSSEILKTIAGSENYHSVGNLGKGKKVDFVFGDENLGNRYLQFCKSCLCHRDILVGFRLQLRQFRVKDSESHPQGFIPKTITAAEPSSSCGCCIDLLR